MVFEKSKRMRKSENVREKVGYRDTRHLEIRQMEEQRSNHTTKLLCRIIIIILCYIVNNAFIYIYAYAKLVANKYNDAIRIILHDATPSDTTNGTRSQN